jgi:tRNA/tmRNA/rRNA uracil-C5-methylase (TrmA/RlmC/RlmD family)
MSFASILFEKLPKTSSISEPFAHVPYDEEVRAKNEAFARFWSEANLPGRPKTVVPSPKPREYRTTTKRRVVVHGRAGLSLGFSDRATAGTLATSLLEPDSHQRIFAFLFDKLKTPAYSPFARALNWLIIRSAKNAHCLIINVAKMDGASVRKAKMIAEHVSQAGLGVTSAMMYFDPSRSDYYLTAERPEQGLDVKHLFGPRLLTLEVDGIKLKYPPTAFSQINESMIPIMVQEARRMSGLAPSDRFIDLYCGYGLFSFTLGRNTRETIAVELEGNAVAAAKETHRIQFSSSGIRFVAARITQDSLGRSLPAASKDVPEVILLDPPRKGADPGVVEVLAKRRPRRVLQICCGTDEIVPAVLGWMKCGYLVEEVLPLDLFAGTPGLETLISLTAK